MKKGKGIVPFSTFIAERIFKKTPWAACDTQNYLVLSVAYFALAASYQPRQLDLKSVRVVSENRWNQKDLNERSLGHRTFMSIVNSLPVSRKVEGESKKSAISFSGINFTASIKTVASLRVDKKIMKYF